MGSLLQPTIAWLHVLTVAVGPMEEESCPLMVDKQQKGAQRKTQLSRTPPRDLPPVGPTSKFQDLLVTSSHDECS